MVSMRSRDGCDSTSRFSACMCRFAATARSQVSAVHALRTRGAGRAAPKRSSTRRRISCAARRVKVSARMRSGASTARAAAGIAIPTRWSCPNRPAPAPTPIRSTRWHVRAQHDRRRPARCQSCASSTASSAAGTRHNPCSPQLRHAFSVGATSARPDANAAASRSTRLRPQADQSRKIRHPFQRRTRAPGLKISRRSASATKPRIGGIHPGIGHRNQRFGPQQRIDRQLRIVGTIAAPIGSGGAGFVIDQHSRTVA